MSKHRLFNLVLLVAIVLLMALVAGAGGAYLDDYDRIKSMQSREARRGLQAAEFCRTAYGESAIQWASDGSLVCIPRGYTRRK